MKKIFAVFLVILLMFIVPCYAQVETLLNGTRVGGTAIRYNFIGDVNVTGQGTDKEIQIGGASSGVQRITTNDTLVAADTGDIIVVDKQDGAGPTFVTLPTAAVGLEFIITSAGTDEVWIIPQATDTIDLAPSAVPLSQGDRLRNSTATTADSIGFISGLVNIWHVFTINGTWADNN